MLFAGNPHLAFLLKDILYPEKVISKFIKNVQLLPAFNSAFE